MRIILSIAIVSLLFACDTKNESNNALKIEAQQVESGQTQIVSDTNTKQATTKIEFVETAHDFGVIDEGKEVEYDFKFKNTGNLPLVISDAKASCGCTIPEWTKEPVQPNAEGKLKVKYNSTGKEGKIHKTVSVYANTNPELTTLDLHVEVIKKDNSMGPIKK
ncbi:MAG: DUF1573 domain-containing protein [Cytophagales bacterium]|nr:MAG: DUF1573 domain-containing protein [Cytophagales bacterium]